MIFVSFMTSIQDLLDSNQNLLRTKPVLFIFQTVLFMNLLGIIYFCSQANKRQLKITSLYWRGQLDSLMCTKFDQCLE